MKIHNKYTRTNKTKHRAVSRARRGTSVSSSEVTERVDICIPSDETSPIGADLVTMEKNITQLEEFP